MTTTTIHDARCGMKLLISICLFMIMIIFIKSFSILVIKRKDVILYTRVSERGVWRE